MKAVPLYRGGTVVGHAMVDDDDFAMVSQLRWRPKNKPRSRTTYAVAKISIRSKTVNYSLHRLIMGLSTGDGSIVDHIDGNGLNCQRSNMRICSAVESMHNRPASRTSKTGIKGVHWEKSKQRWQARLKVGGRVVHKSRHRTIAEAIAARKMAVLVHGIPGFTT